MTSAPTAPIISRGQQPRAPSAMATVTVGLGPRFPACLPAGRPVPGETSPARRCGTSRNEALVEVDLDALATDILAAALVEAHVPACAESITEGLDALVAGRPGPSGGRLLAIVVASGHPCLLTRKKAPSADGTSMHEMSQYVGKM